MTSQQKLLGALSVSVVLLCGVGALGYRSMSRLLVMREAVERTERLLRQLEETYSAIADAETGSRGFVLTGDSAYLRPYHAAVDSLAIRLRSIRQLSAGSRRRHGHVVRLQGLVDQRLGAIRTTVELRSAGGAAAAVAHIRTGRGMALMDSIRAVVNAMEHEEELLRGADADRARAERAQMTDAMVVGMCVALAISLLAISGARRELEAHTRAERALRDARDAAEGASRAKSDFLARMSHELRTPLNSVIGFSNVLLKRPTITSDARAVTYLERIRDNGMHLLLMIDDLLDISRIEVGQVKIARQSVTLDALVHDVVGSFEEDARRRGLALVVEVPNGLAPVDTDPGRLRQVLVNLVGNALKFTERGGVTVRVTAEPSTGAPLTIAVVDTGIGIAPARQAAIFDAFEQADTSTARKYGGTGLGLAISRALCELLGYRLELNSEPGRGSTFTVVLATGGAASPERLRSARAQDASRAPVTG